MANVQLSSEDGAAHWFAREQTAALSRQEREERDAWLARDPANRKAYERAHTMWGEVGGLAAHEQMRELRREALQARPARQSASVRWAIAAAAALAAILAGGYFSRWNAALQPRESTPVLASTGVERNLTHHQTAVGERSTITLPDGSVVTLNTASELQVRFTKAERAVELLRGQAFFTVAQNKQIPFVVAAGGRRVTALGTSFDVRLENNDVQVVLIEGRVAVDRIGMKSNRVELEPGERFVSRGQTGGSVAAANVESSTSWRSGRVVFTDTSLADAVAEINRYRQTPIVLADAAIGELKISGTYRVSEVERFPQALAAYYPLESQRRPSGEAVLLWRKAERAN